MKKFLSITLSILMTLFITGCGSKQKDAPINNDPGNSNITNMEDYELYYGKISSVAGNEIEVSIAKDPYENLEGQECYSFYWNQFRLEYLVELLG